MIIIFIPIVIITASRHIWKNDYIHFILYHAVLFYSLLLAYSIAEKSVVKHSAAHYSVEERNTVILVTVLCNAMRFDHSRA